MINFWICTITPDSGWNLHFTRNTVLFSHRISAYLISNDEKMRSNL